MFRVLNRKLKALKQPQTVCRPGLTRDYNLSESGHTWNNVRLRLQERICSVLSDIARKKHVVCKDLSIDYVTWMPFAVRFWN